jgi:hypothetical protein
MAEYVGLKAIAEKMGWKSPKTPINQMVANGFPMFRRRIYFKNFWVADDQLILMWKARLCQVERDRYLKKKEVRRLKKETRNSQEGVAGIVPGRMN